LKELTQLAEKVQDFVAGNDLNSEKFKEAIGQENVFYEFSDLKSLNTFDLR